MPWWRPSRLRGAFVLAGGQFITQRRGHGFPPVLFGLQRSLLQCCSLPQLNLGAYFNPISYASCGHRWSEVGRC
eukprot:6495429-Pyramimonas_sp.AAC.1